MATRLSGPHEPLNDQSMLWLSSRLGKGKAKMSEFEDGQSDEDDSTHSLNSEYRTLEVPIMRTLGAKKVLTMANEKHRHSI